MLRNELTDERMATSYGRLITTHHDSSRTCDDVIASIVDDIPPKARLASLHIVRARHWSLSKRRLSTERQVIEIDRNELMHHLSCRAMGRD